MIDKMILSSVKCTLCGAAYGKCNCWSRCEKCQWMYETGKDCDHCNGYATPQIVAMNKPRKRRQTKEPK